MRNIFLLLILLFTSCDSTPNRIFEGEKMQMHYKVHVGHTLTKKQHRAIQKVIEKTFLEVDRHYNRWNPHSELSKINSLNANQPIPLSPKLYKLLELTDKMVQLSQGYFDPTVYPLQTLWNETLKKGQVPNPSKIETLISAIGWENLNFDSQTISKKEQQTALDLGGIAKGYCIDLIVERLNAKGYSNIFVEWGGEIRASGHHPENRPWHIFISRLGDPDPDSAIAHLDLQDQAIATSGDYLQYFEIQNPKTGNWTAYFHIIDPFTHNPCKVDRSRPASVTVTASTCAVADAIATSAMLMPDPQTWLEELQREMPELKYWITYRN